MESKEIMTINNRLPSIQDDVLKLMYSPDIICDKKQNITNFFAMIIVVFIIIYLLNKLITTKTHNFTSFIHNHDLIKLLIGLLLLGHVKYFINSLIKNIIMPILSPILPYVHCSMTLNFMNIDIEIGNFISDSLIFMINIIIIYFIYIIIARK
jgi:large-conductance mechanosensitive channel